MSDEFTDEELMAYADGELHPARIARLAALLPERPDLAARCSSARAMLPRQA
jgi:anti-sigma factor RsiW